MTEKEAQELDLNALNGEEIPREFEINLLNEILEANKVAKFKLMALYKINRFIREDEKAKEFAKDLEKTKQVIAYIQNRLNELGA